LEFNSFREHAQQSLKMKAQMMQYDDYYYDEMPQTIFESK